MASFTIRCYTSADSTEKPTLRSRDLSKPVDIEAMHASGFKYLEAWVSPDTDLSQYGWVRSSRLLPCMEMSFGRFQTGGLSLQKPTSK